MTTPNQCDGCRRGLPVDDQGIHRDPANFTGDQRCTRERYANQQLERVWDLRNQLADLLKSCDTDLEREHVLGVMKEIPYCWSCGSSAGRRCCCEHDD
jgi:hypothetical protein